MIMKLKKYIYGVAFGAFALTVVSCYNADNDFPDYDKGTKAYFAYQNPIRTLVLGNDIYDNSLDNDHKCRIWATMGGAYGGRDAVVNVIIDETLCENLYFLDDGGYERAKVLPLPHEFYNYNEVKNATINYNGDSRGYLEIRFEKEFFEHAKTSSADTTFVIPVRMTGVTGIDAILSGTPLSANPVRQNASDWLELPMDYTLYCVRYMNPWQGKYIRRGVDVVTENASDESKKTVNTVVRKDFSLYNSDIEHYSKMDPSNPVNQNDEICAIKTKNLKQAIFPVSFKTSGASVPCNLILTFDDNNKCTIDVDDAAKAAGVIASGNGEFITKGTERSEYKDYQWGSIEGQPVQRDILRLEYDVKFTDKDIHVLTNDTLVVQTRESNKREWFDYKYNDQPVVLPGN